MLKINFVPKSETKTCYRFEAGEGLERMTFYLKKSQMEKADIDPALGITVTVEQSEG